MADSVFHTAYSKEEVLAASLEYFNGEELPAKVFVDKYALRDKYGVFYERTPTDMHRRMAREFARIEQKYPNPIPEDEIFRLLEELYIGPQGSPMFGIGNAFQLVSLSNCAVIDSPQDTMSSILETGRDMANLYKRRFGVGLDISTLRPEGTPVNNAAISSTGAWSFADLFSYITRMVGQSGRRGALMITMDVRHPDIEKFITMKQDLTKVTGANVSVKVSDEFMQAVKDDADFTLRWPVAAPLYAEWENDIGYAFNDILPAKTERIVKARELFKLISKTACECAEPGFLYWDTIRRNLPLDFYAGYESIAPNPCAELPLCAYDSCRLISIYLPKFVCLEFRETANFDWSNFTYVVRIAQRLCDDMVDLELEKLTAIHAICDTDDEKRLIARFIEKCEQGRRTGLGTHGLADALARLRLRYDSADGLKMADTVYEDFKIAAYESSVRLAKERGAFPLWNWETEKDCEFFGRLPRWLVEEMRTHGRRNGALLTNAPTGTRSILSENCSSGIEPVFAFSYDRKRKVDPLQEGTANAYRDANGDYWLTYKVFHSNLERYLKLAYRGEVDPHLWRTGPGNASPQERGYTFDEFKNASLTLPEFFVASAEIDPEIRVEMQGIITKHIDHSVSSTINLPTGTTPDVIESLYMQAWEKGCKGVTIYVDGSRDAQVLTATQPVEKVVDTSTIKVLDGNPAPTVPVTTTTSLSGTTSLIEGNTWTVEYPTRSVKRPSVVSGNTHKVPFNGSKLYVTINRDAETHAPIEVFLNYGKAGSDDRALMEALGRLISVSLKHGTPMKEITKQMHKIMGETVSFSNGKKFTSLPDAIAQVIEDDSTRFSSAPETPSTAIVLNDIPTDQLGSNTRYVISFSQCPQCHEYTYARESGCAKCLSCGYSRC